MRLFALETDNDKFSQSFCGPGDQIRCCIRFHWMRFTAHVLKALFWTAAIAALGIASWEFGAPGAVTGGIFGIVWLFVIPFPLLAAFIDWRYDALILTNEKLVIVNQSSIFRREVREMSLDNVASANAETQYWNIFPFGRLCFDLKEGIGQKLCLDYLPDAQGVSRMVSDALVEFERRRSGPHP